MFRSLFVAFTTASAIPVTLWPLAGLALGARRAGSDLDFSVVAISIPVMFGLYNAATVAAKFRRTRRNMFLAGAALGFMLASLGLYLGIPQRVYELGPQTQWLVLIGGPLFYGAVWALALYPVERIMNAQPQTLSP